MASIDCLSIGTFLPYLQSRANEPVLRNDITRILKDLVVVLDKLPDLASHLFFAPRGVPISLAKINTTARHFVIDAVTGIVQVKCYSNCRIVDTHMWKLQLSTFDMTAYQYFSFDAQTFNLAYDILKIHGKLDLFQRIQSAVPTWTKSASASDVNNFLLKISTTEPSDFILYYIRHFERRLRSTCLSIFERIYQRANSSNSDWTDWITIAKILSGSVDTDTLIRCINQLSHLHLSKFLELIPTGNLRALDVYISVLASTHSYDVRVQMLTDLSAAGISMTAEEINTLYEFIGRLYRHVYQKNQYSDAFYLLISQDIIPKTDSIYRYVSNSGILRNLIKLLLNKNIFPNHSYTMKAFESIFSSEYDFTCKMDLFRKLIDAECIPKISYIYDMFFASDPGRIECVIEVGLMLLVIPSIRIKLFDFTSIVLNALQFYRKYPIFYPNPSIWMESIVAGFIEANDFTKIITETGLPSVRCYGWSFDKSMWRIIHKIRMSHFLENLDDVESTLTKIWQVAL